MLHPFTPRSLLPDTLEKYLTEGDVRAMLRDRGFFDSSKNDSVAGFANHFELQRGGQIVVDLAAGLSWQRSGSGELLDFSKAQAYIQTLNKKKFAGHGDWRLPTLEEAMSLMDSTKVRDYIDQIFDNKQHYIWTADKHFPDENGGVLIF